MPKEGHDYYFIEGGFIVFTKEYHLKRGFCCKNGCRHCPWNKSGEKTEQTKQRK
ncbi:DUF5522 domain-containing protein [Pedobacter sp. P351]|uniref:DUF5522 domain-containing protein n=1 Tax=Pedobacter superstes TaxID=3133441 RepID=UPI003096BFE6